jgi:hypothetical protein
MNTKTATDASNVLTVKRTAELLNVTAQTIYTRLDDGVFPNHFVVGEGGGRLTLIPIDDIVPIVCADIDHHRERLAALQSFIDEHRPQFTEYSRGS